MSDIVQRLIQTMPKTMGACLVGTFLSAVLYGVTLLQTYQYYSRFHVRDERYLHMLVAVLTILDTVSVILNMYSMWFYLIEHYANPEEILYIVWALTTSIIITALVACLVQIFFAYRAYLLGGRRLIIPILIIFFALCALGFGICYMALMCINGSLLYMSSVMYLSTTNLACSLVADVVIASSISIYLMKGREQGMRPTNNFIRKLIIYTINTGVITTTCTAITLILGQALPHTFYNTITYFPLGKCYINSMLAFLNSRESSRETPRNQVSYKLKAKPGGSLRVAQIDDREIGSGNIMSSVQYGITPFSGNLLEEKGDEKIPSA